MGTTFFPDIPQNVLLRHGARILDPVAGVATLNGAVPRPTVYRAAGLIGPPGLSEKTDGGRSAVDHALGKVGLQLNQRGPQRLRRCGAYGAAAVGRDLFSYALTAASVGVVPDAWVALQALRAATHPDVRALGAATQLDHLMFGATVVLDGAPGPIQGVGTVGPFGSYASKYGSRPIPVTVLAPAPARGVPVGIADPVRRPVVAVLDSGAGSHPWLGQEPWSGAITDADEFLFVAKDLQDQIRELQEKENRPQFTDVADRPVIAQPLIGELEPFVGHGTFIAGIVRQVAPTARVLAVRVMHTDGIVHEADLVCALDGILHRVVDAQENGRPERMVDVVSLSMGYFDENDSIDVATSATARAIQDLAERGVPVIAAAGNQGTDRRFFPAALSEQAGAALPVTGVGALNPPGTRALFSNDGTWVTRWRRGAGIVSTMPVDLQGGRRGEVAPPDAGSMSVLTDKGPVPIPGRESFDSDDFSGGFGLWSGSSFATPVVAAQYLNELVTKAAPAPGGKQPQAQPTGGSGLVSRADSSLAKTLERATPALSRIAVVDPPYVHE